MLGRLMSVTERVTEFENNNDETNRSTTINAHTLVPLCVYVPAPGRLSRIVREFLPLIA